MYAGTGEGIFIYKNPYINDSLEIEWNNSD